MANKRVMGHDANGDLIDLTPHLSEGRYHTFDRETQEELEMRAMAIARSIKRVTDEVDGQ